MWLKTIHNVLISSRAATSKNPQDIHGKSDLLSIAPRESPDSIPPAMFPRPLMSKPAIPRITKITVSRIQDSNVIVLLFHLGVHRTNL